jgi:tRNA modification GTPase
MIPDPQDTIVALSSARGPGLRAIVRLSGSEALAIAGFAFIADEPIVPGRRRWYAGRIKLDTLHAPMPAALYYWPTPRSYTGQDVVELHTLSSPPLIDLLIAELLARGARAAQPGEFTLRGFLAGKVDLTRAEAIRGVIEAGTRDELKQALAQLAGGVTQPLQRLREDLLNLLADLEAGLDFTEEDIHFVTREQVLRQLGSGLQQLQELRQQLEGRHISDGHLRAVLIGRPNAGKSSLFNALAAGAPALTSPEPGTTRDYLVRQLALKDGCIDLVDTPGWQESSAEIETQARRLADGETQNADLLLLCAEAGAELSDAERKWMQDERPVFPIATKCDLAPADPGWLETSAVTGRGLDQLLVVLNEELRNRKSPALAPSLSRCRFHVEACTDHLDEAVQLAERREPAEVIALELRGALDHLGEMVGAIYTENLLDRIFSRFCIGK